MSQSSDNSIAGSNDEDHSSLKDVLSVEKGNEEKPKDEQQDNPYAKISSTEKAICLAALLLTNLLSALDMTVAQVIQSSIEDDFLAFNNIGWTSAGYILPVAILGMPWGRLALIIGRRAGIVAAILLFMLGSLISALSKNMNMFIGGRVLSGVGGAGIQNNSFLIVNDMFPIEERPRWAGLLSLSFVVGSVIGPLIGGGFASNSSLTWRWAFYVNLPIGGAAIVAMVLGYRAKPSLEWKDFKENSWKYKLMTVDAIGTVLVTSGLTLLLLALSFGGNEFPWKSAAVICCFLIGGLLLVAFFCFEFFIFEKIANTIQHSSKAKMYPLFLLDLVKDRSILATLITLLLENIVFFMLSLFFLTYFELVLGYSPKKASYYQIPCSAVGSLCALFGALFVGRTGYVKQLALFGGLVSPLGSGLMLLLNLHSNVGKRLIATAIPGVPFGILLIIGFVSVQTRVSRTRPELMSVATSTYAFARSSGGAIGSNLGTAVFTAVASAKKNKVANLKKWDISVLMAYQDLDLGLTESDIASFKDALVQSLHAVFYLCLGLSCAVLFSILFISNEKSDIKKKSPKPAPAADQQNSESKAEGA